MSPAKSRAAAKKANADTASNISAEVLEINEIKTQKKGKAKKALNNEEEAAKVENIEISQKANEENLEGDDTKNATYDVEMEEPKQAENGETDKDGVHEDVKDNDDKDITDNVSEEFEKKMEVVDEEEKMEVEDEKKNDDDEKPSGKNKKKAPAKKDTNAQLNKKGKKEEKISVEKADEVEKEKVMESDKPTRGRRRGKVDDKKDEEQEKEDEVEKEKVVESDKPTRGRRGGKVDDKKDEEQEKEDEVEKEKVMESDKPTRGRRGGKVEDKKDEEPETNARQTRQRKTDDNKKPESPKNTKASKAKEVASKTEEPKNKRGPKKAQVVEEMDVDESEVDAPKVKEDKKATKKAVASKSKETTKDDKDKAAEKKVAADDANTRKRKANSDAKDSEKQTKKTKYAHDIPSVPMKMESSGSVLAMGSGDFGQLGLGPDVIERSKPKKLDLGEDRVVQIAVGGMHSLCVTSKGEIYSFGCNDEAALGRPAKDDDEFEPAKVVGIEEKIVQAVAGDSHSAALSDKGQVYIWGTIRDPNGVVGMKQDGDDKESDNKEGDAKGKEESKKVVKPVKILHGVKITKIAGGCAHILCLSDKGEVYSLGGSDVGQLGRVGGWFSVRGGRLGTDSTLIARPVRFKKRVFKCVNIWAGAYASFAKSTEGEILAWGLNNYYQLGFDDMENRMFPEVTTAFDPKLDWKHIACAEHHTLALDGNGKVYCIGRKDYGRLGLGSVEKIDHIQKLTLIESLASKKCVSVGCDSAVSYAIDDEGITYGWGMGSNMQLGFAEKVNDETVYNDVFEPTPIKGELEKLKGIMAVPGSQHTLYLAAEKS